MKAVDGTPSFNIVGVLETRKTPQQMDNLGSEVVVAVF